MVNFQNCNLKKKKILLNILVDAPIFEENVTCLNKNDLQIANLEDGNYFKLLINKSK